MGIDAKETIVILWRILSSSTNITLRFMRNHPILSTLSMFLLLLYIFLPSLIFFLLYSSPVLACAVVYAREKLGLRFATTHETTTNDGVVVVKSQLRQQRSVRRNARMKVEEWDSQTSEDEKDKVILTSLYNDLLGRTPHFEESPKAVEDNDDDKDKDKDSVDMGDHEKSNLCECEIKDESFDGKEEEEMSNVNEQGISEIERNKRLESLIARRRTRRLFKLAIDQRNKLESSQNNNNLHVTVPKTQPFDQKRRGGNEGLSIPGSAPSVLLQGRNPFDIPYDPQEERPILTGDSFDEEFNHKDMFFCRHESLCRFAQHPQCTNSPVHASDISKRLDLDNKYIDHTTDKNHNNEATINGEGNKSVEVVSDETDSSSFSEESETELNRFNNVELREAIYHSMDNNNYPNPQTRINNNIPSTLPRGLVPAPRVDDNNNMFYTRSRGGSSHSRTFSVASDMQVEVSELGSPPTTVDWLDDWSTGGESYIYDTDIEREIVRNEESRKKVVGSKEETKQVAKPNSMSDEELNTSALLHTRSQSEEIFAAQKLDVSETTSSDRHGGLLFHTSASLSSITEEPEVGLDSIDRGNLESIVRGENDVKKDEETDLYEATRSLLDSSSDTPCIESSEREMEVEKPNLDITNQSSQEHNNRANVQEGSIVSEDSLSSQGSQPWIQQVNSSEGISPRTLEIIQKTEDEDVIASNTVSQDIVKDEFGAETNKVSADSESNDEEVGEAMEKELELDLESVHHNKIGLVDKDEEDNEESMKVIEAMQGVEAETTKDETRA